MMTKLGLTAMSAWNFQKEPAVCPYRFLFRMCVFGVYILFTLMSQHYLIWWRVTPVLVYMHTDMLI